MFNEFPNKKRPKFGRFFSRGRGNRTPVNGFGDRRTTAVLFPYISRFINQRIVL